MRALCVLLSLTACDEEASSSDLSAAPPDLTAAISDGGIGCGNTSCPLGGAALVCCIEAAGPYCAPPSACSVGTSAYCDGPEDCAGGSCCRFDATLISCTPQCPGEVVCHADGDCPAAAPRCCDQSGYRACASTCS